MQTISDTIDHLRLGEATTFEGLTVFPLFGDHVYEKATSPWMRPLSKGRPG